MPNIAHAVKKILDRLMLVQNMLNSILQISEDRFLILSQNFQSIYSDTDSLKKITTKAIRDVIGDNNKSLFEQVGSNFNESIAGIKSFSDEISSTLHSISNGFNYFDKLCSASSTIKSIAKNLKIIAINIGIESSRTEEYGNVFSLFTQEIKQLANTVGNTTTSIYEDAVNVKLNQSTVYDEIVKRKKLLEELSTAAEKEIKNGIENIYNLINISTKALNKAGEHSRNIQPQVNNVIEAIQFQDISRQQIEHIINTINEIQASCNIESPDNSLDQDFSEEAIQNILPILNLQINQLHQVILEIQDMHSKISEAFLIIGSEIENISCSMREIQNDEIENPFNTLKSELERIEQLVNQGHEVNNHIVGIINESSNIVSDFSNHLEKIEHINMELQIKAINAVILSTRLENNGKVLEVLAQQVTEISKGSKEFVAKVVNILESIAELSDKMKDSFSNKIDSVNNFNDQNKSFIEGINKIDQIQASFIKDSSLSFTHSVTLKNRIASVKSNLSFLTDIESLLMECITHLEECTHELQPFSLLEKEASIKTEQIMQRYTMDIERGIHDKTLGNSACKKEVIKEDPVKPNNKTDKNNFPQSIEENNYLGDNVELF